MKKAIVCLCMIFISVVITACERDMGDDDLRRYKGIAWAEIPGNCLEYREDICELFDCMVDMCWCDDSSPDLPIIYEKEGVAIQNEEEAMAFVNEYLNERLSGKSGSSPEYIEVKRAVELNNIFYNVFAEEDTGNEIVYTVAVDGTIIKTICGV